MTSKTHSQPRQVTDFARRVLGTSATKIAYPPEYTLTIRLLTRVVRLCFSGPNLFDVLASPVKHLQIEASAQPDAVIYVWDSESTGVSLPALPDSFRSVHPSEDPHSLDGETFFADLAELRMAYHATRQRLSLLNYEAAQAVFWIPSFDHLHPIDGRPLRILFQWLIEDLGAQVVHAAGVGHAGNGALLVGIGGSGKSTSSLVCLGQGLSFVGDDNLVVLDGEPPMVYGVYSSAVVDARAQTLLGFPGPHGIVPRVKRADKDVYFLNDFFPEQMVVALPLAAIVVARVRGTGESSLLPCSPAQALIQLAPTSIYQIPGSKQAALSRMTAIVRKTPTYQLTIGEDINDVPALMTTMLERQGVAS